MDDLDHRLLAALGTNSSLPTSTLARDLGMARSTVQARIERLERAGIIAGYTIRLGDVPGHRRIRATVLLQIEPRATPAVMQRLKPMEEVETCLSSSGRVDLILSLSVDSTQALDATLDKIGAIPGVKSSESLIHLSTKFDRRV
jgi:DNA-binding Lrp family transcriptional regulator